MRLIDADSINWESVEEEYGSRTPAVVACQSLIQNTPTIDHVQVVRCEDCKHSQYDELFHMRWCHGEEVKNDDFCSYGAKMDLDTTGE